MRGIEWSGVILTPNWPETRQMADIHFIPHSWGHDAAQDKPICRKAQMPPDSDSGYRAIRHRPAFRAAIGRGAHIVAADGTGSGQRYSAPHTPTCERRACGGHEQRPGITQLNLVNPRVGMRSPVVWRRLGSELYACAVPTVIGNILTLTNPEHRDLAVERSKVFEAVGTGAV